MGAPKKPMDHLRKEVEPVGPLAVVAIHGKAGDDEVEILQPLEWGFDVQDLVAQARFGAVFDSIMDAENAAKAKAVQPTMADAIKFMKSLEGAAGTSLGELLAS